MLKAIVVVFLVLAAISLLGLGGFGLVVGLIGGIFGLIGGLIGGLVGLIGALFGAVFGIAFGLLGLFGPVIILVIIVAGILHFLVT